MKNKINLLNASIGVGIIALALFVAGSPSSSQAATYAYVNTSGEVRSVEASSPELAIQTAVGRTVHSGVILLTNLLDYGIIGNQTTNGSF